MFLDEINIIDLLGKGGFSKIYIGRHVNKGLIAVKVLEPNYIPPFLKKDFLKKFIEGAKIWINISHKNIVNAYYFRMKPIPYIVLKYIDGWNLLKILENGIWLSLFIKFFIRLGKTLIYIHRKGFTHNDIKFSNILVTKRYGLKLTDFDKASYIDSRKVMIDIYQYLFSFYIALKTFYKVLQYNSSLKTLLNFVEQTFLEKITLRDKDLKDFLELLHNIKLKKDIIIKFSKDLVEIFYMPTISNDGIKDYIDIIPANNRYIKRYRSLISQLNLLSFKGLSKNTSRIKAKWLKYNIYGCYYFYKNNYETALKYFNMALKSSEKPFIHYNYAMTLIKLERYEEAFKYILKIYEKYNSLQLIIPLLIAGFYYNFETTYGLAKLLAWRIHSQKRYI